MSREQYESWTRALAIALQVIGLLGIVFVFAYGAVTGNFQLGLLPFCGGFAGGGVLLDTLKEKNNRGVGNDDAANTAQVDSGSADPVAGVRSDGAQ